MPLMPDSPLTHVLQPLMPRIIDIELIVGLSTASYRESSVTEPALPHQGKVSHSWPPPRSDMALRTAPPHLPPSSPSLISPPDVCPANSPNAKKQR